MDHEKLSDKATIRNAVSSANIEELHAGSLPWANIDTGSRGAITDISEFSEAQIRCRKFTVSIESYEGVALHRGTACLVSSGEWKMIEFASI